jgi:hypothetical protein
MRHLGSAVAAASLPNKAKPLPHQVLPDPARQQPHEAQDEDASAHHAVRRRVARQDELGRAPPELVGIERTGTLRAKVPGRRLIQ